jgi:glucose/arabinose dehydrogenase
VANGVTYVADAGANAVVAISPTGVFSTVAALKPVKLKVTAQAAGANHLPRCTVGKKYAVEAVPTDVEYGPDGQLYVTSLPGGPEDPSFGANGRVLRINPATGKVTTIADGLLSPTGVAVAANGDVYVAQLFPGLISKIAAGHSKVKTYAKVAFPAAVEVTPTGLLATANSVPMGKKPKGQVITITP